MFQHVQIILIQKNQFFKSLTRSAVSIPIVDLIVIVMAMMDITQESVDARIIIL